MAAGIVVALEQVLHHPDVVGHLEAVDDPVVADRVHLRAGRGPQPLRLGGPGFVQRGEGQLRRRGGLEQRLARRRRQLDATRRPRAQQVAVALQERVAGELDRDRGGARGGALGDPRHGVDEARVRLLVAAEEVLDRRAEAGDLRAHLELVRRQRGDRLHHRVAALLQAPGDGAVERPGGEQRDATGRVGTSGSSRSAAANQCPAAAGARVAAASPASASSATARSSPGVAACSTWRASIVAGAPRASSAAAARACAANRHPSGDVVHGPAQDRVAEAHAPWHVGRPDQVARQQHVERVQRGGVGLLGDRDREVELERLADDRAGAEQRARGGRKAVELDRQRGDHRRRHDEVVVRRPRALPGRGLAGPGELLEVERVAPADRPEPVRAGGFRAPRKQRDGVGLGERPEVEPLDETAAGGGLERCRHPPAALPRAVREREHQAARRGPVQHVCEHLDGGFVRPVQVVEDQQQPAPAREPLQQARHRAVCAEAAAAVRSHGQRRD